MNAVETIRVVVVADDSADTSWLEQDEFADRLAEYHNGDFGFVGLRLEADVRIPHGKGWIISTLSTPGLWGIESDSGEEYFLSVADDEYWTLAEMLRETNSATPANMDRTIRYR